MFRYRRAILLQGLSRLKAGIAGCPLGLALNQSKKNEELVRRQCQEKNTIFIYVFSLSGGGPCVSYLHIPYMNTTEGRKCSIKVTDSRMKDFARQCLILASWALISGEFVPESFFADI